MHHAYQTQPSRRTEQATDRAGGKLRIGLSSSNGQQEPRQTRVLDERALGAILGHLELSGRASASQEAGQRASGAISDLQAFLDLRAWRQHPGADNRGRRGMQQLGLQLTTFDYEAAWRHLQARVVVGSQAPSGS